jgi:hypothetical protein
MSKYGPYAVFGAAVVGVVGEGEPHLGIDFVHGPRESPEGVPGVGGSVAAVPYALSFFGKTSPQATNLIWVSLQRLKVSNSGDKIFRM